MKKLSLRKLFSISAVMLVALSLLFSCDNTATDGGTGETDTPIETVSEADALDISSFKVVRSETSEKTVTDAAVKLRNSVNEICGTGIVIETDWVKRGESAPTDTAEIVVGNTNRLHDYSIKLKDYKIIREANRIYIIGGSDEATVEGVEFFISNMLSPSGVLLEDKTDYLHATDYKVDSIVIGGKEVEAAALCDGGLKLDIDGVALRFADLTGNRTVVTNSADEANIIFTDAAGHGIDDGNWGVVCENGKVYIIGRNEYEQRHAYSYFGELLSSAAGTLEFKDGIIKTEHQTTKEEYYSVKQLSIYPEFPEQINRDYTYSVSVTQDGRTEALPVYNHAMQNNVRGRSVGGDLNRRFSMFAFCGAQVRVDIKVSSDFSSYSVLPSAKNFKSEFKDGVISVYLDEPEYFLVRLDGDDNSIISVFADYPEFPEDIPNAGDPNVTFIEGWVEPEKGFFDLNDDNSVLYIAPGSVLNARVLVKGKNARIFGHGAIVDPYENIYEYDISVGGTEGNGRKLLSIGAEGVSVDGPVMLDARCFNVAVGASNVTVRNLKCMSVMMTTDGVSVYTGKDALVEHCFLYVGDNAMVFSAENTIYRDITIGTTCAAIFPQGSPKNTLLEGIHIFRTNDGVINNFYNGGYPGVKEQTIGLTIRNLDAVDCGYIPWLFRGYNMGTLEKVISFENISIPTPSGVSNPYQTGTPLVMTLANDKNHLYTENYSLNYKNLYVAGQPVTDIAQISMKVAGDPKNTYSFANDGSFKPVEYNTTKVDYTAPDKVFAGQRQLYLKNPMVRNGGILLPADEIRIALRTGKTASTEKIGEVEYVKAEDLVRLGIAEKIEENDGSLYITPANGGGNLLLPDSGEISYVTEATCYELDLVVAEDDEGKYYAVENIETLNSGLTRFITDEIRTFGAGEYTLSFRAKGSDTGKLTVVCYAENTLIKSEAVAVKPEWQEIKVNLTFKEENLSEPMVSIIIKGAETPLDLFGIRELCLSKTK